jgi:predicted RNase H-like HicB family nuclease
MDIQFTVQIFKEGRLYVAYTPELDVSSCGGTQAKAKANLLEAVRLFLEEADKMGTLEQILEEGGFVKHKSTFQSPRFITTQRASLPLMLADG